MKQCQSPAQLGSDPEEKMSLRCGSCSRSSRVNRVLPRFAMSASKSRSTDGSPKGLVNICTSRHGHADGERRWLHCKRYEYRPRLRYTCAPAYFSLSSAITQAARFGAQQRPSGHFRRTQTHAINAALTRPLFARDHPGLGPIRHGQINCIATRVRQPTFYVRSGRVARLK